jgi:hypothetical protein
MTTNPRVIVVNYDIGTANYCEQQTTRSSTVVRIVDVADPSSSSSWPAHRATADHAAIGCNDDDDKINDTFQFRPEMLQYQKRAQYTRLAVPSVGHWRLTFNMCVGSVNESIQSIIQTARNVKSYTG